MVEVRTDREALLDLIRQMVAWKPNPVAHDGGYKEADRLLRLAERTIAKAEKGV